MNEQTRNILIGVGLTFLAVFLVIGTIFSGSFLYYMGRTSNEKEVARVEIVANTAQNTANIAKDIAVGAQKIADNAVAIATGAEKTANEAKCFTEKVIKEPVVKIVYPKPPVDQNEKLIGQIGSMVDSKLDARLKPISDQLENLKADQIEIKEQVKDLNTRFGYIETDVNKISDAQDRMKRMLMGEKEYLKFKEKELQQKDCNDLSGNK